MFAKKPKFLLFSAVIVLIFGCFAFLRLQQIFIKNQLPSLVQTIDDSQKAASTTAVISTLSASSTGSIKQFSSLEELKSFLSERQASSLSYGGGRMMADGAMVKGSVTVERAVTSAAPSAANASSPAAASGDYSKTNNQIAGVDEADIIKTDGAYVYVISNSDLFIIKAQPASEAEILTKISFKSRPQEMYINGDSLAIFGNDDQIYAQPFYKSFRRQSAYSFLKVFDIKDRKQPKLSRDLSFEGNYFSSRMIGNYLYFISNNYSYYYDGQETPLPRLVNNGKLVGDVMPPVYYFDIPYESYNFTTVASVNLADSQEEPSRSIYLMSGAQNVFVSENNLYLTYTKYLNEYDWETSMIREKLASRLSAADQERISKVEAADDFILSPSEKLGKIRQVLERYIASLPAEEQSKLQTDIEAYLKERYQAFADEMEKTVIHKIGLEASKLSEKGSGEVRGSVLNQFSMDEQGGYFRIATTRNRNWSRFEQESQSSYNNVYVLDSQMNTVGRLENIASGEKIYSARFMGNRAYLVTFRQTDPLFAIDLSDPSNPRILGELKIPGFSSYLHPYDDNTLIGIGKEAEDNGAAGVKVKGLKVALFDVSDASKPKVLDTYTIGDLGSDSTALYDHKAVLFSKEKNRLVIPAVLRNTDAGGGWGDVSFNGALVFSLNDGKKIELLGKISHGDNPKQVTGYWYGYDYYDNSVKRSLYIGQDLYTSSDRYLKINSLDNLSEIKSLELKKEKQSKEDDFEIIN